MKQPNFFQSLHSHNFWLFKRLLIWNWRLKLILKITEQRLNPLGRGTTAGKIQMLNPKSCYHHISMQERFIPMYSTTTFDSVTSDNSTKYLCLSSHFLIPERAVEQPSFSMGLMQKPLFLSKTLTNPALQVAHINGNQVSISCTDMESPVCP